MDKFIKLLCKEAMHPEISNLLRLKYFNPMLYISGIARGASHIKNIQPFKNAFLIEI